HVLEGVIILDDAEGDRLPQSFQRRQIHTGPISFVGGRVRICLALDSGDSYDLFFLAAVVVEDQIALLHRAQVVARGEIADARPLSSAIFHERGPCVSFGLLFYEPMLHSGNVHWPRRLVTRDFVVERAEVFSITAGVRPGTLHFTRITTSPAGRPRIAHRFIGGYGPGSGASPARDGRVLSSLRDLSHA